MIKETSSLIEEVSYFPIFYFPESVIAVQNRVAFIIFNTTPVNGNYA
jgi:hypothetical protein